VKKESPDNSTARSAVELDVNLAWALLSALVQKAREGSPVVTATGFGLIRGGFRHVPLEEALCIVDPRARPGRQIEVRRSLVVHPDVRGLMELYLPLVIGARASELTVGHVGPDADEQGSQEWDKTSAERGPEQVLHTHRMRALFDAVILGVRTVMWDDPQLTTRLVPGPNPTRVILDPHGRLEGDRRVLRDATAHTVVCVDQALLRGRKNRGHVDYLGVPVGPEGFDGRVLVHSLRSRYGLRRLFVEGGSTTVARFLAAGLLDRVQVSVAPLALGPSPVLRLGPMGSLKETLSPSCRHFRLGAETFFDFDLLTEPGAIQA
jgi:diaminohydroxyphosphoribosylaminopyrimidine deaminase/5-amino-6-(5-phosphoribosylamino)uracil reductase